MNQKIEFTHLHVHSEYSLLDCSAKIKEIISRTKDLGMDSVAITDHGVMYGVIDFYKEAKKQGIKPIIGCEMYVATSSRFEKNVGVSDKRYYHLVLLAENNIGYQNLIELVSKGFTEGFYYKPRVDHELLRKHSEGLIALSACLSGEVPRAILNNKYETALEKALLYEDIFGKGNFFLEVQDHLQNDEESKKVNENIVKISKETNIPLICTNDSHYIYKEDNVPHDILLCIQSQKTVEDEDRMKYKGDQFYIKSPKEMYDIFKDYDGAIENTKKIADRCSVEIKFHEIKLPKFDTPKGYSSLEYFQKLADEGLKSKYENYSDKEKERLDYEIKVINDMGFVDYFLIVWDFIRFAKEEGISVGPGRGSAAGSIVSYCLDITNIDPMKYNLIFERFLNPARVSMPDIDIDFCYERRQEVIDYVIQKYGEKHVANIITFGTLAARSAIKDVGRALAMPYGEVDRISKMIPFAVKITIDKAMKLNKELRLIYENEPKVKYLIDMAKRLEGLPRHASTHAAGILICEDEVTKHVPLNVNDGVITTQFPMDTLEELGLLKMDFLGLRTLTVIDNCLKEIERIYNKKIDIYDIDLDCVEVFDLISQAKTTGVFQLESRGMRAFFKELKAKTLEDIIAGIALFRPGPMDYIPKYIKSKNLAEQGSRDSIEYADEKLVEILEPTYGVIVYQEQVMQIVRELAGYSMARSDMLRRVMSSKKTDEMDKEKQIFIYGNGEDVLGCINNGVKKKVAESIFAEMYDFAKYAFNKSHAAAYALLAYQTAWLKVKYPVEFMSAILTSVIDNESKVAEYIAECRDLSIEILSPDINESFSHFSVSDGKIRYALSATKNVGKNSILKIVQEREENGKFFTLNEFINRMDSQDLNRRMLESLIKAGAFDCFNAKRSQLMSVYRTTLDSINDSRKKNLEGQINLFEGLTDAKFDLDLPIIDEFRENDILRMEKEVLGIYMSGHPLMPYKKLIEENCTISTAELSLSSDSEEENIEDMMVYDNQRGIVAGIIIDITKRYTKLNNRPMAFVTIEDLTGFLEVIVFPDIYEKVSHLIENDNIIFVKGQLTVSAENGEVKIKSEEINDIEKFQKNKDIKSLGLVIEENKKHIKIDDLINILSNYKGSLPVYVYDKRNEQKYKMTKNNFVSYDDDLHNELELLLGKNSVLLK